LNYDTEIEIMAFGASIQLDFEKVKIILELQLYNYQQAHM